MTRRILFCTIGTTPQVVTETVWALLHPPKATGSEPWRPDEIHVVTTSVGLAGLRGTLQDPNGRLAALFKGKLPPVIVYVPKRDRSFAMFPASPEPDHPEGGASKAPRAAAARADLLADVNSEKDAAIMGDVILRLMAEFVRARGPKNPDPAGETEVHLSLAGGRKTMSAHALLAITLVGREQDKASHVLVSPADYEDNREFWYPGQPGGKIRRKLRLGEKPQDVKPSLDPNKAKVSLVQTVTPLMRYEVKDAKALEELSLTDLTLRLNAYSAFLTRPDLRILTSRNVIVVNGREARLSAKLFAFYRLIATACHEQWPGIGSEGTGGVHCGWLSVPQICFGHTSADAPIDRLFLKMLTEAVQASPRDNYPADNRSINKWKDVLKEANKWQKEDMATGAFRPNMTNLQKSLDQQFGSLLAHRVLPVTRESGELRPLTGFPEGRESAPRFGLALPPQAIRIV